MLNGCKSSLIYDYEDDTIDFSRSKPTEWNGNKRIHLPKSGSSSLESYFEVRRGEASRLYDKCIALLDDGNKKGFENISNMEKQGVKSLQKQIKNREIIVCQCDKSGKFAVLTTEQYIEAGAKHIIKEAEITEETSRNIERNLNGHMRWWANMTNLSET